MAKVGINTGSYPNAGDGSNLRAGANIINSNFDELYTALGDGTTLAPGIVTSIVAGSNISVTGTGQVTISSGLWEKTDAGINTVSNVGIGTTNPRFTLEVGAVGASGTSLYVNGDARVTGILTVGSSSVTLNGSTNEITVGTGITISGNTGIISATQVNIAGETLTGAGVTSLVAGSNITLSGSTGQVTISSAGGALASRTTKNATITSLAAGASGDLSITAFKAYNLLKIAINHPAWVRLYVNAASRTSDASRAEGTDPLPGSGVIAEVLTTDTGVSEFLMSPAVFGWNNDGPPAATVYAKVTNKDSSSSRDITVTLTLIEAEA